MSAGSGPGDVAVIIPARDEADRIRATVTAAAGLPGVALVVVVDDGSRDTTAEAARRAGAAVVRHARSRGKGAAMETGAELVRLTDQREHRDSPRHLLFLDADLADTAALAGPLADPVLAGTADMTVAVFSTAVKLGGHLEVAGPVPECDGLAERSRGSGEAQLRPEGASQRDGRTGQREAACARVRCNHLKRRVKPGEHARHQLDVRRSGAVSLAKLAERQPDRNSVSSRRQGGFAPENHRQF